MLGNLGIKGLADRFIVTSCDGGCEELYRTQLHQDGSEDIGVSQKIVSSLCNQQHDGGFQQ